MTQRTPPADGEMGRQPVGSAPEPAASPRRPAARTVRAQPGLTWGEFDRECQAFGLASTGGAISTTGIAGLTLGGGIGWLGAATAWPATTWSRPTWSRRTAAS